MDKTQEGLGNTLANWLCLCSDDAFTVSALWYWDCIIVELAVSGETQLRYAEQLKDCLLTQGRSDDGFVGVLVLQCDDNHEELTERVSEIAGEHNLGFKDNRMMDDNCLELITLLATRMIERKKTP